MCPKCVVMVAFHVSLPYSLNVGDVALFIQDNHLNMLAVTTDHRIYYLDHMCAEQLADISSNGKVYLCSNYIQLLFLFFIVYLQLKR